MELDDSDLMSGCQDLQPFTFSTVTCSNKFSHKALKAFLVERGLYGKGLWRHLCLKTMSKGLTFGKSCKDRDIFVLQREDAILQSPLARAPHLNQPIGSWSQYYCLRGFELDSPICGILDYPLTLYWVITHYFPKLYAAQFENMKQSGCLLVHIIGAEKEADMFPAFIECGHLLGSVELNIHLFGDEIWKQVDGEVQKTEKVSFHLHSGLYHECHLEKHSPPDIVIGFNSGLSAYPSFMKTVQQIVANETPFFCTDYCYESVMHCKRTLQDFQVGRVKEIRTNPFHGPFRIPSEESQYPCYSNAFVYSVQNDM